MIKGYITLATDDGADFTEATDVNGIATFSMDLTTDWNTELYTMSIGGAAAWGISWSGITSGGGTLTLQLSANQGLDWVDAVESDGSTVVTVSVTGVPTEQTIVAANKCNALHYRWKYEDTDTAGADAVVIIYMQVEG